jgi:hypothetical protein
MAIGDRDVYKDDAVRAMDDFFSGIVTPLDEAYDYARHILNDRTQSLAEHTREAVAPSGRISLNERQVNHFENHWPGNVQDEMRRGYLEAVELADGRERAEPLLPIETFWVTGPNAEYEIHARKGPRQVTVLVFIPPDLEGALREPWEAAHSE